MTRSTKQRWLGVAALVAGAGLVVGPLALSNSSGDDAPSASAAASTTTAESATSAAEKGGSRSQGTLGTEDDCSVDVTSAIFVLDASAIEGFAESGLSLEVVTPANVIGGRHLHRPGAASDMPNNSGGGHDSGATDGPAGVGHMTPGRVPGSGRSTAPIVESSSDVSCDFQAGSVTMKGGFAISSPTGKVEFHRFLADLGQSKMDVSFSADAPADLPAFALGVDSAQFTNRGSIVSGVVPISLDPTAAAAMSATLGLETLEDAGNIGTVTISGGRNDSEVDPA